MARVKRGVKRRIKREKVLGQAKGYWGAKSSNYRTAKEAVEKSLLYAYRDRRARKGEFRKLWIQRINAACRENGTSYSRITAVAPGTTLEYVASAFNGWQAVKIGSQVGWVSGEYSEITTE